MPLYEYECLKCHKRTEKIEKVVPPHLKKCPHCGGPVERLVSAPAIQFKGSGWYVNDYGKSSSGAGKSEKQRDGGDKSEKSDRSEKSDKSEKSESKSSDKSSEKGSSGPKEKKSSGKEK